MVIINKDLAFPPESLIHSKWNGIKSDVLLTQNNHNHSTACYRDSTIESLKILYKNKCAFCEREYGDELEVDHYRPKKGRDVKAEPKYNTTGYYWLSYEWSNLILCCSKCNGQKSNKFPLVGWTNSRRISSHQVDPNIPNYDAYNFIWIQGYEEPLLLNPESDREFEKHLRYLPSGIIKGITDKGKATIEICDLNRGWLITQRRKLLNEYVLEINEAINEYTIQNNKDELKGSLKNTFKKIQKHTDADYPFSLFHCYISYYFKFFIGNKLQNNVKNRICDFWNDYLNSVN